MKGVPVSQSRTEMTEVVLPNDTNPLGILLGGRLLYWMDIAAAICAQMHSQNIGVTIAMDHVQFLAPARMGDIIEIQAQVTNAFNTSIEIMVEAWKKNTMEPERIKTNEAYFTFVAVDSKGRHLRVPPAIPETDHDKSLYNAARIRRQERLGKSRHKKITHGI